MTKQERVEYETQEAEMLVRQGFLSPTNKQAWIDERVEMWSKESVEEKTKKGKKRVK